MILRSMIDRFQNRVDDNTYWNDDRAIALLNTMKDKLAQEVRILTPSYYTFNSVVGEQHYEVPSKLVASHYLYYNSSYNTRIKIVRGPQSVYGPYAEVTQEGWPSIAYLWGVSGRRQLTIYPTFNVDGITIQWWFWGWPEDLANDNDEPQMPIEWHPSLIEGMINQAKVDDREMSTSDALILWKDEVRKVRALESTIEIMTRGGKYGSFDYNFPRIADSADEETLGFRPVGEAGSGVIW